MVRVLVIVSVLFFASAAPAGIGEPLITYHLAYEGGETLCLLVVPDGSGPPLTEARTMAGYTADATVMVEILDLAAYPLVGYPPEDVWMISRDGGLVTCDGGFIADAPTDANGHTTISLPPRAGGWSLDLAQLMVNGSVVTSRAGVDLVFNSPDLNGDLLVNLSDVQLFAGDFFGFYAHRSDLYYDGTINLSDIVPLA